MMSNKEKFQWKTEKGKENLIRSTSIQGKMEEIAISIFSRNMPILSNRPRCQRNHLRQRRRKRCRHWRCPADWTRWVEAQPRVYALQVEEVAALRQNPKHIAALVIRYAYGAAGGGGVLMIHLCFRIQQLRVTV